MITSIDVYFLLVVIMVYSSQSAAFRRDKNQFFTQVATVKEFDKAIEVAEQRAQSKDYFFLLNNQQALETEFTQMFELLKKDSKNKEQFWLYCYYCASLLEHYHRAYSQIDKVDDYQKKKLEIKKRLIEETEPNADEEKSFVDSLYESFIKSIQKLIDTPNHLSSIRDSVAYANLCRIYWVFSRLTLTSALPIADSLKLIDKLDAILGTHTNVDKVIASINAPVGIVNYFSVGLFLARFMIDGGLLIKHTFFPSKLEQDEESSVEVIKLDHMPGAKNIEKYRMNYLLIEGKLYYIPKKGKVVKLDGDLSHLEKYLGKNTELRLSAEQIKKLITDITGHKPEKTSALDRFYRELYKRHCNYANDLVWALVNFLTNFNRISGIPDPITGYLTAVFLVFDIGMALYKCHLAKNEYLLKKSQYLEEFEEYSNPDYFKELSQEQRLAHLAMLHNQLNDLELTWKAKEATFYFAATAATLLMLGFTAAMIINAPVLVMAAFFVCTIAVGMYFSTDSYNEFKKKSLTLEQAQLTGNDLALALKEYHAARNDFMYSFAKNTVGGLLMFATYAVCWPAALALTAAFWGYGLYHSYGQHHAKQEAKQLVLAAPSSEVDESEVEEETEAYSSYSHALGI